MFSKSWLTQISIVLSRGMVVKSESTSKLPINNVGSWWHISSENCNGSLTVYSFLVEEFNMGTKNVARQNESLKPINLAETMVSHLLVVYVPCNFDA